MRHWMGYARSVKSRSVKDVIREAAAQLLRLIPGSKALALKRNLRDAAQLAQADAVIVSYPKSGRTFVRAMLSHLFQLRYGIDERQLLEFPLLRRARAEVPRLLFTHAGDTLHPPSGIRIDPEDYAHVKTVLIARHPAISPSRATITSSIAAAIGNANGWAAYRSLSLFGLTRAAFDQSSNS